VNLPTDEGESAVLEFWILNPREFAHHPSMSAERLSIPRYAMALAHVASLRSEDPYRKVGAAALDHDNRVIGTAYNGLAPGFNPPSEFWDDREARQKFMLHAEVNLCSLFRRGEAKLVATTTMPCTACMQTLCAYGIREIYYRDIYHASDAPEIAKLYGVRLERVADFPELDHLGE
jgi:dCMP deaminase